MSALAALWSAALFVLQVVIVVGIPWAVLRGGRRALTHFAPSDFFEVPLVIGGARLLGVLLGVFLLSGHTDAFDLKLVFGPESPWNLTVGQFLAASANPLWSLNGVIDQIVDRGFGALFGGLAVLIGLLIVSVLAAPLAFWSWPTSWRAALSAGCVAIITAYITIYGISLLFWLLFLLNFWVLALLLVIFQWYRSRG